MTIRGSVRVLGWMVAAAGTALGQGSTLPAAQPTAPAAASAPATASAPVVARAAVVQEAARRARVTWVGGQLTIAAENSSMNQILREISRVTGMKVTGGVADERVYGSYGPGTPEVVLESLLTGTGTNMLLKESAESAPVELVLSPRKGGATPPGPASFSAGRDDREDDLPPQRIVPSTRAQGGFGERPGVPDAPAAGSPGGGPSPAGADTTAAAPAAATTDAQSPNGVKTPQQIYDQLMKLQQQKAAQTAPPQ